MHFRFTKAKSYLWHLAWRYGTSSDFLCSQPCRNVNSICFKPLLLVVLMMILSMMLRMLLMMMLMMIIMILRRVRCKAVLAPILASAPQYMFTMFFFDASRSVLNIFRLPSTGLQNAYFFHQIKHIQKLFSSSSLDKTVLSMTHLCSSLVPVAPTDSSVTFTSH